MLSFSFEVRGWGVAGVIPGACVTVGVVLCGAVLCRDVVV